MGGNMDGMGDLDNAPMPPMGSDDMGMKDPMAEPMGGEEPNDMGNDQLMDNGDDDELMNVFNNLSMEDKAAVIKYAKSMEDNGSSEEMPQDDGGMMPMESRKSMRSIIDETINDVLNDKREGTERPKKDLPKEYRGMKNPFKSPY